MDFLHPPSVPGSSSSFSIALSAIDQGGAPGNVSGLWVNCKETGVTLSSACSSVVFNFDTLGLLAHFSIAAGSGENCADSSINTYGSASSSHTVVDPPVTVSVMVTGVWWLVIAG